ncbi:MAG: hypothetical protein HQ517_02345 [SAR324 cluster bacterium]|nr:hypothetical protein [SAR324 cluster bacterium]
MKNTIKDAVRSTVQDMLISDIRSSFTKKELDQLGVTIPELSMTSEQIKKIR